MKKNYFFNLLLSVANIIFPIVSFPYVSRTIGPSGIGKVQFITTYASYFALVASLGIPIYGVREIAKYKDDKPRLSIVFSELSIIYLITSFILSCIYALIIVFVPYFNVDKAMYLWSILIIILSFTSIDWFYAGIEAFKTVAIRSVLVRLVSLVFMFLFIKNAKDYKVYFFIIIFTTLANNMVNVLLLKKHVRFTLRGLSVFRHSWPLLLIFSTTIATSMYTMLDTVLLGFLSDDKAVGLYSAAVKLSKIAIPVVTSLGFVLVPRLTKFLSEKNTTEVQSLLNKSYAFIIFFAVPMGVGLAILAPELITAFSSKKFLDGTASMQVLSILPLLIGFGYFFGFQILVPDGRDKELLFSVIGGVVTGLVLNVILVPRFKQLGASVANVGSELVVTLLYYYFVRKFHKFEFSVKPIYSALISSLLFIPLIFILRSFHINVYLLIMASIAICGTTYFSFQIFLFKNSLISDTILPAILAKISYKRKTLITTVKSNV